MIVATPDGPTGPAGPAGRDYFDDWSARYDADVAHTAGFPFAGYDDVLAAIVTRADVRSGMSVLDLGTGTGAVAGRVVDSGCRTISTSRRRRP